MTVPSLATGRCSPGCGSGAWSRWSPYITSPTPCGLWKRSSLAALHRVKGIKEETVLAWLREAAKQVEQIEALLLANYQLTRAQLDALWTYVGNKGEKGGTRKKSNEVPSGAAQP
jgi:hypothetical protein